MNRSILCAGVVALVSAAGLGALFLGDEETAAPQRAHVAAALLPAAEGHSEALTAPAEAWVPPAQPEARRQRSEEVSQPGRSSVAPPQRELAPSSAPRQQASPLAEPPLSRLARARQRFVRPGTPAERLERAETELDMLRAQRRLELRVDKARRAIGFKPDSPEADALAEVMGIDESPFADEDDDLNELFD